MHIFLHITHPIIIDEREGVLLKASCARLCSAKSSVNAGRLPSLSKSTGTGPMCARAVSSKSQTGSDTDHSPQIFYNKVVHHIG